MNIDIVGRVRPPLHREGSCKLEVDWNTNTISTRPGGSSFSFQYLHKPESTNYDVFKKCVESLLELCVSGVNTSLIVVGESGSGKSYTVGGQSKSRPGLLPILIEHIFTRIGEETYMHDNRVNKSSNRVCLQMYEIYNELIRDLLQVPGIQTEYLEIAERAEEGVHVRNLKSAPLSSASDGTALFRQAWARRTETYTDHGPARNYASVVIQLDLTLQSSESPFPNKSRFTVVVTPGAEKLAEDSSKIRLKEGPTLSKSLICLSQLAASLANQPYPDRVINYGESKLTRLLSDEVGGNSKTRVLVCFKPQSEPGIMMPILNFCTTLSQITNFPVMNDSLVQRLLSQYRARIIYLQQQQMGHVTVGSLAGSGQLHEVQDELKRVQTENLHFRDKNERLHQKLEQLQNNFGSLTTSKTDLSAQLLMTEEEKLKVSKTLVEMQIENNKLKEEVESAKFELTNKILQLENDLTEMEMDRDRHAQASKTAKDRLGEIERDRKDLADEYVALKTNYLVLQKAQDREKSRNEEMSIELLNLVNAKAALMRQMDNIQLTGLVGDPNAEVERVRGILSRLSSRKVQPEDVASWQKSRDNIERNLFGEQKRVHGEIDRLRTQYDEEHKKMERKLTSLYKDLNEARNLARERQRKIAEQNAKLITMKNASEEMELLNNRLQHKVKDVNEEFRSRLVKYVEDIAAYVDSKDEGGASGRGRNRMKNYVNDMLQDMKKSHRVREEQLSHAATSYKDRMQRVIKKHEELLVSYRELKLHVEAKGLHDLDLGVDEHELQMTESDLVSGQQKEINRLREDLSQALRDVENLQLKLRLGGYKTDTNQRLESRLVHFLNLMMREGTSDDVQFVHQIRRSDLDSRSWDSLRKELREFTLTTQQELEQERAELLSDNSMLKQEVKELEEYIDSHLVRYKAEIERLREQLGMTNDGEFVSPGARRSRHKNLEW